MRRSCWLFCVALLSMLGLVVGGPAQAQAQERAPAQEPMPQVPGFEPGRAILNDAPWFDPFRVLTMESLAEALDEGSVTEETPLLVLTRGGFHLALLTMQMTYHHVAQGTLQGEPWMVSF